MVRRKKAESLQPVLRDVEKELDRRVAETCEHQQASQETTGELERFAEQLSVAAQAAKTAAALRRTIREEVIMDHLERRLGSDGPSPAESQRPPALTSPRPVSKCWHGSSGRLPACLIRTSNRFRSAAHCPAALQSPVGNLFRSIPEAAIPVARIPVPGIRTQVIITRGTITMAIRTAGFCTADVTATGITGTTTSITGFAARSEFAPVHCRSSIAQPVSAPPW